MDNDRSVDNLCEFIRADETFVQMGEFGSIRQSFNRRKHGVDVFDATSKRDAGGMQMAETSDSVKSRSDEKRLGDQQTNRSAHGLRNRFREIGGFNPAPGTSES